MSALKQAQVEGIGRAQRLARSIVLDVAATVKAGDTERQVVGRMEAGFRAAGVRRWLHTPYAWWGERTCFSGFGHWEPSALPTARRLAEGEAFILDAAPLVEGYPADFATSGLASSDPDLQRQHRELLQELSTLKDQLVAWAGSAVDGRSLVAQVGEAIARNGHRVVHALYPAGTLGHALGGFPSAFGRIPRMGSGFQWPLLARYAVDLVSHHLAGTPYPFLNESAPAKPQGLWAVEPHLGHGALGAKFESVLLIDGDETRWLDPGLFGEVSA